MCVFNTDEANDICIISFYNLFPFIRKNNIRLFYTCITDKIENEDKEKKPEEKIIGTWETKYELSVFGEVTEGYSFKETFE